MTRLKQWQEELNRLDTCPWPGPRPLGAGESNHLFGREDDLERFTYSVLGHRLVILTGDSGSGKSSFVNTGLPDAVRKVGFAVFVCSDWNNSSAEDPSTFFVENLLAAVKSTVGGGDVPTVSEDPESVTRLFDWLESRSDRVILVFDQFEEVARQAQGSFLQVLDWLDWLHHERDLHIVISLRSEYAHRLRPL
jgi:hypothetical protein